MENSDNILQMLHDTNVCIILRYAISAVMTASEALAAVAKREAPVWNAITP